MIRSETHRLTDNGFAMPSSLPHTPLQLSYDRIIVAAEVGLQPSQRLRYHIAMMQSGAQPFVAAQL